MKSVGVITNEPWNRWAFVGSFNFSSQRPLGVTIALLAVLLKISEGDVDVDVSTMASPGADDWIKLLANRLVPASRMTGPAA